jgi:carbamoyl-phosphate synthase large subunit
MTVASKRILLISGVCGDIGCSAVRSLREAADRIIGCDMRPYSPVRDLLDGFYEVPAAVEAERYLQRIKDILSRERISFFLPIPEPEIQMIDEHRAEMEGLGPKLLLNNRTIVRNFLDKLKTAQFLSATGVKAPRTELLQDYKGGYGFPVIVKPRTGYGSKRLWRAEDDADLDYLRRKDDGLLIVQEYLGTDSDEYTTGVFSDGKTVSSITFRRKLGFGGLSAEAALVDAPAMDELANKVAVAVQLEGCINIQTRIVGDIFVPFEINPRLSSTVFIRKQFGFDDAVWWLDLLLGKTHQYRKRYRSGKVIRCVSECYFDMVEYERDNQ